MRTRWTILIPLLLATILIIAGCSTAAGSQEGDEPAVDSPTADASDVGTIIIESETIPPGQSGAFQFTGVPSGTVPSGGTLVVSNLEPGTYTSTEVNPAPDFEVTAIDCDDGASATPSSGDPGTRSAVFNLDPGEMVTCTFTNTEIRSVVTSTVTAGGAASGATSEPDDDNSNDESSNRGTNPFDDPGNDLADFPLPEELPPGAGTFAAPKPGPWSATNFEGQMGCGDVSLSIPASPPESGVLEVLEGGRTLIGTGLQDDQTASITLTADPNITGRYTGSFQGTEQGVPVTINYFWQVVTDEYIVGFLTASLTAEGRTCSVYRPYELVSLGG
jgi:hypothetical protein